MKARSVHKKMSWSPEERARHQAICERFQKEKPTLEELVASGECEPPIAAGAFFSVRQAIGRLQKLRQEAGLSLADVSKRSGLDKAVLSRLEHGQPLNPTFETLWRYACGVGVEIHWTFRPLEKSDEPEANHTAKARRRRRP